MDFEQIENAIITRLKTNLAYVKTIETYAGQLEANIETFLIQFPAIYTIYAKSQFDWVDGRSQSELCTFGVIVVTKNLRGKESLRKDTQAGYQLIKDVLASLTNQNFGLDIDLMKPVEVSLLFVTEIIAAYTIEFQTSFDKIY